ncbi:MAG: YggS family pyridoxal phosphate-dependent enzyme [Methylocella sp.]
MTHSGLESVRQEIRMAALAVDRDPAAVTLIAVTKSFGLPEIMPVIEAGQIAFGENRVQESKAKWPPLKASNPHVKLHLIGPLQSNKAADAIALFDAIHTLDRRNIAETLAKEMWRQQKFPQLFVQVNTGIEGQKSGVAPGDASQFIADCRERLRLDIAGLMCIPPLTDDPRAHFEMLAEIAKENGLPELSMGMSGDYATAIACGATFIRVGSAIFGSRS